MDDLDSQILSIYNCLCSQSLGETREFNEIDSSLQGKLSEGLKKLDKSLISDELIKSIKNLDQLSYNQEIKGFIEGFEKSDDSLNQLILKLLNSLWVKKYEKSEAYRSFGSFESYEKILLKQPYYRDHYIHQFQVFLSGLPIVNKHHHSIKESYKNIFDASEINVEFAWLLAASFHDVGYTVQYINIWIDRFFKDVMEIPDIKFNIDLNEILFTRNYAEYIDKLVSLYLEINNPKHKPWRYSDPHLIDNSFRREFLSQLLQKRNHGLISSLILLDRIQNSVVNSEDPYYIDTTFSSTVMPAALAIALHDKSIFSNGIFSNNLVKNNCINFSSDPLTFTLIFCDTLQEWGRPGSSIPFEHSPKLSKYEVSNDLISATLTYDKIMERNSETGKTDTFSEKEKELTNVFSILKSKDIEFAITLVSKDPMKPKSKTTKSTLET